MIYMILFAIFTSLVILYLLLNSYAFQFLYHKHRVKKGFIEQFQTNVKGKMLESAYFAPSHKIISNSEYRTSSNRQKINFSKCYNIITFKTADVKWEMFFNIIREDNSFSEVFNLRAFPAKNYIKTEGNVEKNYSRLNIFTNNGYLTHVLEKNCLDHLKWLIRHNGDILLISNNNLHFKAILDPKVLSSTRAMDMVKAMHSIKTEIYKDDVIEY